MSKKIAHRSKFAVFAAFLILDLSIGQRPHRHRRIFRILPDLGSAVRCAALRLRIRLKPCHDANKRGQNRAWKLDTAKSRLSQSPITPKELTDTYKETTQGTIELTRSGIQTDGAAISSKWSWPKQGGLAQRVLPDPLPKEMSYVAVLVAPGKWYVSIMNAGKQVSFYGKDISKNGKTMQIALKGMDEKGHPFDELFVSRRQ